MSSAGIKGGKTEDEKVETDPEIIISHLSLRLGPFLSINTIMHLSNLVLFFLFADAEEAIETVHRFHLKGNGICLVSVLVKFESITVTICSMYRLMMGGKKLFIIKVISAGGC